MHAWRAVVHGWWFILQKCACAYWARWPADQAGWTLKSTFGHMGWAESIQGDIWSSKFKILRCGQKVQSSFPVLMVGLCLIAIYRRVVVTIAIDHWNSWSRSFTSTLYCCNIMWPAVCRQCHVSVHPSTVVCSRRMWAGRGEGEGMGEVTTSTAVCLTHSIEKVLFSVGGLLQLQAYNTGQTTSAIRLSDLFTRGHWHCDHDRIDRDQIVAWHHDHRSLKWSHEHSPNWWSCDQFYMILRYKFIPQWSGLELLILENGDGNLACVKSGSVSRRSGCQHLCSRFLSCADWHSTAWWYYAAAAGSKAAKKDANLLPL